MLFVVTVPSTLSDGAVGIGFGTNVFKSVVKTLFRKSCFSVFPFGSEGMHGLLGPRGPCQFGTQQATEGLATIASADGFGEVPKPCKIRDFRGFATFCSMYPLGKSRKMLVLTTIASANAKTAKLTPRTGAERYCFG